VDLWESPDLDEWQRVRENPILNQYGLRWPSVVRHKGEFYMLAREPYTDVTGGRIRERFERIASHNRILKIGSRVLSKVAGQATTSIGLFRSSDGVNFEYVDTVVEPSDTDRPVNQNPFVFENRSGRFVFVYYTGDSDRWEIRLRTADTPSSLASAEDSIILQKDRIVAAPTMFYHEQSDKYVLLTETVDQQTGDWVTEYHTSSKVGEKFETPDENIVYSNDQACAAPFVFDSSLYVFVSQRRQNDILQYWEGKINRYRL
jgi:hypothetical protein